MNGIALLLLGCKARFKRRAIVVSNSVYGIEFEVSVTVARRLNQLSSQVIEFDELVEPTSRY